MMSDEGFDGGICHSPSYYQNVTDYFYKITKFK